MAQPEVVKTVSLNKPLTALTYGAVVEAVKVYEVPGVRPLTDTTNEKMVDEAL